MDGETIYIETERLVIRTLQLTDEQGMWELDNDPEVHRYLGGHSFTDIAQTREIIANMRMQYLENSIARWAVVSKADGAFMGWTGFRLMREAINNHCNYYDFGYRFIKKYWNQGYATESATAALHYGVNHLHLRDIYAMTDPENQASRRVLEKIGFRYAGLFPYDGANNAWRAGGEPTTWYTLSV